MKKLPARDESKSRNKMKNSIIKSIIRRAPLAVAITGATAYIFMRFVGGAAMYCIDPPAADPGWEWKVPAAWITIYGASAFIGILSASFRSGHRSVAFGVGLITVALFIGIRWRDYPSSFFREELLHGIPALLVAWAMACLLLPLTGKPNK